MKKIKDSREWLKVFGISALLIVVGFYVAYQFVGPAPTKNIIVATGSKSGAYYRFGLKYADRFKEDGVELSVLETAGSIDNLSQFNKAGNHVHAALIQGGVGTSEAFPNLESLGSLYYEPLWLFHGKAVKLETLGDLKGKRIALGSQASGTYALATQLLSANHVTPQTSRFLEIGAQDGIEALTTGKADVLFVVAGTHSGIVRSLLDNSAVRVYSFRRADAYVRNFKFLSKVILPQGSFSLDRNIPDRDISLVAPAANLVIRNDLHPALIYLLMMAAEEAHLEGGLLEARGAFPSPKAVGFPLNKEAKRFYQSGPPILMRVLPFWLATWMVRMFIMLIPLITILYPLMKIAPPTYTWRVRSKVYKLYKQLHRLELDDPEMHDKDEIAERLKRLEALDRKAESLHVPASYLESRYNLRRHMDWMRSRLKEAQKSIPEEK